MALISCPDCGHRVSDQAPACPSCGRPIATSAPSPSPTDPARVRTTEDSALTRSRGCGDILVFGVAVLLILVLVVALT